MDPTQKIAKETGKMYSQLKVHHDFMQKILKLSEDITISKDIRIALNVLISDTLKVLKEIQNS